MTNNFVFEKDLAAKKIHVVREFNAPIEKVWKAWTDPDILQKWWGPKPWVAVTKSMDFTVGGAWLYSMDRKPIETLPPPVVFEYMEL